MDTPRREVMLNSDGTAEVTFTITADHFETAELISADAIQSIQDVLDRAHAEGKRRLEEGRMTLAECIDHARDHKVTFSAYDQAGT